MGNICLICTYMSAFNINSAILDEGMDVEVFKSATNSRLARMQFPWCESKLRNYREISREIIAIIKWSGIFVFKLNTKRNVKL